LIIVTGGVNRHNGIIEGRAFQQLLRDRGVPEEAFRVEDRSANTWQNVELATPYLREAIDRDLPLVAVSKWYHRRSIHALRTHLPDLGSLYAIGWDPIYADTPVTRYNWPTHPEGRRRVIREWREIPRRVAAGEIQDATRRGGAWN
jgi:hypothetical protein